MVISSRLRRRSTGWTNRQKRKARLAMTTSAPTTAAAYALRARRADDTAPARAEAAAFFFRLAIDVWNCTGVGGPERAALRRRVGGTAVARAFQARVAGRRAPRRPADRPDQNWNFT